MNDASKVPGVPYPGPASPVRAAMTSRWRLQQLATALVLTGAPLASLADTLVGTAIVAVPEKGPYIQPRPTASSYHVGPASRTSSDDPLARIKQGHTLVGFTAPEEVTTWTLNAVGGPAGTAPQMAWINSKSSGHATGSQMAWINSKSSGHATGSQITWISSKSSGRASEGEMAHINAKSSGHAQEGFAPQVDLGSQLVASSAFWGHDTSVPVNYVQYGGSFLPDATLQSSAMKPATGLQTVPLGERLIGDNAGGQPVAERKIYSFESISALSSKAMSFDPAFVATRSGYAMAVDTGVGNVSAAVPEPSKTVLSLAGLLAVAWIVRNRANRTGARLSR